MASNSLITTTRTMTGSLGAVVESHNDNGTTGGPTTGNTATPLIPPTYSPDGYQGDGGYGEEVDGQGNTQEQQQLYENATTASIGDRMGTVHSARFNLLATMVSGGSLSLPMAFQKAGNGLLAPVLLIFTAVLTEVCLYLLILAARTLHPVSRTTKEPGSDNLESIVAAAFGSTAYQLCKGLITIMCFLAAVAYAVLLRDMLEPVSDWIVPRPSHNNSTGDNPFSALLATSWFHDNICMLTIVLAVTPLCMMRTLTALERFQATSMLAVLILASCIAFRSLQCNIPGLHPPGDASRHRHHPNTTTNTTTFWHPFLNNADYTEVSLADFYNNNTNHNDAATRPVFQWFPDHWRNIIDVLPIFVSCYVCHYNAPLVHNELQQPSKQRTIWWLRSTVWSATAFYMMLGIAGSAYAKCAPSGSTLHGNILLDFDENDPIVLVGRLCLAITITLAFPMLIIPARDVVLRSIPAPTVNLSCWKLCCSFGHDRADAEDDNLRELLLDTNEEPMFLPPEGDPEQAPIVPTTAAATTSTTTTTPAHKDETSGQFVWRLLVTLTLFWSAAAIASGVDSVEIVWDLMGSSLSMLMSYLIPAGAFLVLNRRASLSLLSPRSDLSEREQKGYRIVCWILLVVATPLMFLLNGNAIYNVFFTGKETKPH